MASTPHDSHHDHSEDWKTPLALLVLVLASIAVTGFITTWAIGGFGG